LLICAGGTGGGVYPALAVLQAMEGNYSDILWVGGEGGMEENLVKRLNLPYQEIPAAGVHGVGLRSLPGNIYKLIRGVIKSAQILNQYQPDVIFYTGGYLAAPMAVAGFKKPSVLYVPDIEPGIALKFIAKFAHTIALTTENSKKFFNQGQKLVVTGYPLREELKQYSKVEARKVFNLNDRLPVLLIYGGSKGAHTINQVIKKNLEILLTKTQIIHVTGNYDWADMQQAYSELPAELSENYRIYPYIHEEMSAAFSCADLCVCRGGASTLGELPFFGLPAIVVPYPYAWRYQKINAQYLVDHHAAIMLPDEEMDNRLLNEIIQCLSQLHHIDEMRSAMHSLSKPDAAQQIGNLITQQFNLSSQKGGPA
jgi:UDP-N-acetylglucosamine--N-acetylmuramyl-(pentapeptide) pyrophosphoryl-undecaprenol N-acetylglucosamine transferase